MPELPEVETIRRGIVDKIKGKKITSVDIKVPKLFVGDKKDIIGAEIVDAKRVAKILEIVLSNGYSIVIHLKLTGQLVYRDEASEKTFVGGHSQKIYMDEPPHAYTHIIYEFSDGSHLFYNDFRRFGWNKVLKTDLVAGTIGDFGPEPMTAEFTADYLKKIFSKTAKPIKVVIMDQAKISGIGNIYANDALYDAGIMPNRPAKTLTDEEIAKFKNAIENVLELSLKYGGSSENTYVNIEGKKGHYMEVARVYQKEKDPKGHPVTRIALGGRGTFYCEECQK
jgi:formamidopyrimidine-DNA glycosylase